MTVTIEREGSLALATVNNPPVNALSRPVRQALLDAADFLDADRDIAGVVLLCAGRTFIAGADVTEFGSPAPPRHRRPHRTGVQALDRGHSRERARRRARNRAGMPLPRRIRRSRVGPAGDQPRRRAGVGGTVRLPRVVGAAAAVEIITSGSTMAAGKAATAGLVDLVAAGKPPGRSAEIRAERLGVAPPRRKSDRALPPIPEGVWERTDIAVRAKAKREAALTAALACIRAACETDFDSAMAFERTTFLTLRGSEQAVALRHVFFAERASTRPPELDGLRPRQIGTAAVIGGGTMGAGIVAALRDAGIAVVLVERNADAVQRGLSNVRTIVDALEKCGRIGSHEAAARLAGVTGSDGYGVLSDVDLVIEAVFEEVGVKRSVFSKLSDICRADAILATNTSYLDPEQIVDGLPHPERFLGLHFFGPANVMKLLEVVPTSRTSPEVLATAFALARRLGKVPVRAGICDGFIGNRLLKVFRAQAERLLLTGATPEEVDAAMRRFGMPMGPFEAQALGGLDIAEVQRAAARDRGETPFAPIADRLCAIGRYGRKTGAGWYDYVDGDRTPRRSDVVARILKEEISIEGEAGRDEDAIADAIVLPLVSEAAKLLDEKIALRSADIDLVEIHGYGFPRWRGGPLHQACVRGLSTVVKILKRLSEREVCNPPSNALVTSARKGAFHLLMP